MRIPPSLLMPDDNERRAGQPSSTPRRRCYNTRNTGGQQAFTIVQANVQHSGPTHDTLLAIAHSAQADIILVQEPWTVTRRQRQMHKGHPAYKCFAPRGDWGEDPPKVMTYVSKKWESYTYALVDLPTTNIICTWVYGLTIYNVYRPPRYPLDDPVISLLEEQRFPEDTLVAGDFNATHWSWAPGVRLSHHNPQLGDRIAEMATEHGLVQHIGGVPTHEAGNTLDLAMSNGKASNRTTCRSGRRRSGLKWARLGIQVGSLPRIC
ncbi:Endonuclease/exonuclease/phosphatase [Xylaria sp. CBS 124048]|nr:Endonuclease/exonuclease/phosphatase [Xylaria sp. CBS 124048]